MMIAVPGVLTAEMLARVHALIDTDAWADGNATSGHQSARAKRNRQLPEESEAACQAGAIVLDALAASARFVAAALPLKVFPPLFSRYERGDAFGAHVDTAVRIRRGSDFRLRSDLSATLFLSAPDTYDGGALVAASVAGERSMRLAAGDMLLYPASSVHRVDPVTRGTRLAAFFWVQSMVRDDAARALLLDLDDTIQDLGTRVRGDDPAIVRLTGTYHNLMRRWADL